MTRDRNISVKVICQNREHVFKTFAHEYRSLMALIYDKIFIESFGDCKGIGRCGTCHVHIINGNDRLLVRQGNEFTTLNKMQGIDPRSRLSCQILVDESIDGIVVEVVDDDDPGLY